jgi:hypothetical protein
METRTARVVAAVILTVLMALALVGVIALIDAAGGIACD